MASKTIDRTRLMSWLFLVSICIGAVSWSGAVLACDYEVSVSVNPTVLPRDGATTANVTVTVTRAGIAQQGVNVTMSASTSEVVLSPANPWVTGGAGQAFGTVRSLIADSSDLAATIYAYVGTVGANAPVTFKACHIALASNYNKIYYSSVYHAAATLTATVTVPNTSLNASGSVTFGNANHGTLAGSNPCVLSGSGVASIQWQPGTTAGTYTASATMGRLSDTTDVQFVGPGEFECSATAKLHGTDGEPFPGGTINFVWNIPANKHETHQAYTATTDPIPDAAYMDNGPVPDAEGWGTWQVTSGSVVVPQGKIKVTDPTNWALTVRADGSSIGADWTSNGNKYHASYGADRAAVQVTLSW